MVAAHDFSMNFSFCNLFLDTVSYTHLVLSFASCKDTEGSIGDPIISHGQDRDTDIIKGDDYVYHLTVIFHVFYSNTTQYIEYTRLKEILSNVNELYQGDVYIYQMDTIPSENLHILFELAEKLSLIHI